MVTVVDFEAGMEHLKRGTGEGLDGILIITTPHFKALEAARQIAVMASELGVRRRRVVLNQVHSAWEEEMARQYLNERSLGPWQVVPYDQSILREGIQNVPIGEAITVSPGWDGLASVAHRVMQELMHQH